MLIAALFCFCLLINISKFVLGLSLTSYCKMVLLLDPKQTIFRKCNLQKKTSHDPQNLIGSRPFFYLSKPGLMSSRSVIKAELTVAANQAKQKRENLCPGHLFHYDCLCLLPLFSLLLLQGKSLLSHFCFVFLLPPLNKFPFLGEWWSFYFLFFFLTNCRKVGLQRERLWVRKLLQHVHIY